MTAAEVSAVYRALAVSLQLRFAPQCRKAFEASSDPDFVVTAELANRTKRKTESDCFAVMKLRTDQLPRAGKSAPDWLWLSAIPKAGSTSMRVLTLQLVPWYKNRHGEHNGEWNEAWPPYCETPPGSRLHFTQVRDPFERLISGFREVTVAHKADSWLKWRRAVGKPPLGGRNMTLLDEASYQAIGTKRLLNEFIEDLGEGYENVHTQTQSHYIFHGWPSLPDFVGHLEDGHNSWRAFMLMAGMGEVVQDPRLNFTRHYQKEAVDYRGLLTEESWRRFCDRYHQDYACFFYVPPPECR